MLLCLGASISILMKSLHNSPMKVSSLSYSQTLHFGQAGEESFVDGVEVVAGKVARKKKSRNATRMCEQDKGYLFINNQ